MSNVKTKKYQSSKTTSNTTKHSRMAYELGHKNLCIIKYLLEILIQKNHSTFSVEVLYMYTV